MFLKRKKFQKNHKKDLQNKRKYIIMVSKWRKVVQSGRKRKEVDSIVKGRLIMPSKLRQDIGEKFIITKGLDGCLFVFSQNEWLNFESKLKALPLSDKNARNFVRFFLSGATECEIDKQGRFLIPANLREAAKLEKDAVIVGVGTRLEIWDKEIWQKCDENISADEIAENMTMLGI
mgnify:CR=1 FL=1